MELDKKWHWRQRKLECRVRPETGNPSGDDLRDRLAALAGVNLQDLLAQMKKEKQEKEKINKGVFIDYEADKKQKEVLRRSHLQQHQRCRNQREASCQVKEPLADI